MSKRFDGYHLAFCASFLLSALLAARAIACSTDVKGSISMVLYVAAGFLLVSLGVFLGTQSEDDKRTRLAESCLGWSLGSLAGITAGMTWILAS